MSDLTPQESAALRARIVEGAGGLPPRRSPARLAAIASAVALVSVIAVGSISLALGRGSTTDTMATPTPTASESQGPSPTPSATPTQTPTPTATPEPAPEPTEEPVVLEVGDDIVTPAQWDLVTERGWGYYFFLEQQRYVATDPSGPLPAEVTGDIQRRMDAIPNDTVDVADGTKALMATQQLMWEVASTGKQAVMVRYNVMSAPDDPTGRAMRWYAQSTQTGWWMQVSKDRDKLLGDIDQWVAANTVPGSWVVFVGPGEPFAP